jgi:hypothetical protein
VCRTGKLCNQRHSKVMSCFDPLHRLEYKLH